MNMWQIVKIIDTKQLYFVHFKIMDKVAIILFRRKIGRKNSYVANKLMAKYKMEANNNEWTDIQQAEEQELHLNLGRKRLIIKHGRQLIISMIIIIVI